MREHKLSAMPQTALESHTEEGTTLKNSSLLAVLT